jgi:hypothetical protein
MQDSDRLIEEASVRVGTFSKYVMDKYIENLRAESALWGHEYNPLTKRQMLRLRFWDAVGNIRHAVSNRICSHDHDGYW